MNLATLKRRTLFVSLEMHPSRLVLMFVASRSGLEERRIISAFEKDGRPLDALEQARFDAAMRAWEELGDRLWIHSGERDGWTQRDVLANCTRVTWDAIILDHGRLLSQDNIDLAPAAVEGLRRITAGKGTRPWVLAVWPLKRDQSAERSDDEPRMPRLSDFWGGSSVEYAADTAIVLQKRAKLDDESAVVPVDAFVLKNRDGPFPMCVALDANGRTSIVVERGAPQPPPEVSPPAPEPGSEG